jgi:hypothetical protein
MKLNSIILIALLSTPTYAFTPYNCGEGCTVVYEKMTCPRDTECSYKAVPLTDNERKERIKQYKNELHKKSLTLDSHHAAYAHPATTRVNQSVTVTGKHIVYIENLTHYPQLYHFQMTLSVNGNDKDKALLEGYADLNNVREYYQEFDTKLNVVRERRGVWYILAMTSTEEPEYVRSCNTAELRVIA